jgi:hypothetical protein
MHGTSGFDAVYAALRNMIADNVNRWSLLVQPELEPIHLHAIVAFVHSERSAMRILVLLVCISRLEGRQREERQLRLDPPIATLPSDVTARIA